MLLDFLERATVAFAATRDANLVPRIRYVCGWRHEPGGEILRCMIEERHCDGLAESLADNRMFAVTIEEIGPHETYQFKGDVVETQAPTPADLAVVERARERLVRMIHSIYAIPEPVVLAYYERPGLTVRLRVREIYVQTPGPAAGRRLVPAEAK